MAMTYDLPSLRHAARLAGFDWTDAELEAILPAVESTRALLAALEAVDLDGVEAATRYTAV
ncbi:MAG TPA: hypothetical protein VMR23_17225 [Candidatus Limnocylindria bacterium]|nr:hypothetical protein [Candidatus Limnocylindria bacterium]